jgi:hypothetical protein
MKKTLEEEDTLLQAGPIETSDVESKDTLFGSYPNHNLSRNKV